MTKTSNLHLKKIVGILKTFTPGKVPFDVWLEMLRLNGSIIVEAVPIRIKDGRIQIYAEVRPNDDPHFAGQFCLPGKVVHGLDTDEHSVVKRLIQTELKDLSIKRPIHIDTFMRRNTRSLEMVSLYLIIVTGGGREDSWHRWTNSEDGRFSVNYNQAVQKAVDFLEKNK